MYADYETRAKRYAAATDDFEHARGIAEAVGLSLLKHTDQHYSLRSPDGWCLDLYPGNRRIFRKPLPPGGKAAPYIKAPKDWTLTDIVIGVIGL